MGKKNKPSEAMSKNQKRKQRRYHQPSNERGESSAAEYLKSGENCSFSYRPTFTMIGDLISNNLSGDYSFDNLKIIQSQPHQYLQDLIQISWIMYNTNGNIRNTVDGMSAMPTLDSVTITYGNDKDKNDRNKELTEHILSVLRHKSFIREHLRRGFIEGAACSYIEVRKMPASRKKFLNEFDVQAIVEVNEKEANKNEGSNSLRYNNYNIASISLPSMYTRIVGYKNGSPLIAFDLRYFDLETFEKKEQSLRRYPKEIRDGYQKWKKEKTNDDHWLVLDNDHTVCHKVSATRSEIWGRPLALSAIDDVAYNDYFKDTKRNVLDDINNRVYVQTFPEGKDKGTSALTQKQQRQQHDTVKKGVQSKNRNGNSNNVISVAAGTKINVIDPPNQDIFDKKYEENIDDKIALDVGFAGALLNGIGSGNYAVQTLNLEMVSAKIFEIIEDITNELNKVINALIIQDCSSRVEVCYLPMTYVNRDKMVANMKNLYTEGRGSLSLWASACGISPSVMTSLMDYEKQHEWESKYPPHATSYNSSGDQISNSDKGGRPADDDSVNENTVQSKANDANNMPKPGNDK